MQIEKIQYKVDWIRWTVLYAASCCILGIKQSFGKRCILGGRIEENGDVFGS